MRSKLLVGIGGAIVVIGAGVAMLVPGDRPAPRPAPGAEDAPAGAAPPPATTPTPTRAPAPPPTPAAAAGRAAPARPHDADERADVARLRTLAEVDPPQALALAAELERRHPGSPFAEERASLVIDALVRTGDVGRARTNAETFLDRFPNGAFAVHVETLTGVHPHPPEQPEQGR